MSPVRRWMFRAPVHLYRWRLGWILGRRFLLLEHTGRTTGRTRRSILEVTAVRGGHPVVVSGFGTRSDWYRNVTADPNVHVTWGRREFDAVASRLARDEAVDHFTGYQRDHPRATKGLAKRLGVPVDRDPDLAAEVLPAFELVPRQ